MRRRPGARGIGVAARVRMSYVRFLRRTYELTARITIRPDQCHGSPCVRGMRIRVVDVLEMLAGGISEDEILADFPDLESEDIRACLSYAVEQLGHPVVMAAE